jgi:2-polyprenyl-3-methyl-5-hydroxy-6-metoxy-1,4-benzoquinol methylase
MGAQETAQLQAVLDDRLRGRAGLRVLEAGCGSTSHVRLPPDATLVGIDISQKQLDRNARLAERIRGDVQAHDLGVASFDVIICWDVLEHLPYPERALERFVRALRPDGLLVLALPHALSFKGMVTKLTPHAFHVWFYRRILGQPLAGTEDRAPFPTFMRAAIAPHRLVRFAEAHGLVRIMGPPASGSDRSPRGRACHRPSRGSTRRWTAASRHRDRTSHRAG